MAVILKRNTFEVWRDVIFALFIREIRTGFNDKFGLSWAVLNPLAFIFILSFIRGRLDGGETHTIPIFVFMVYGMLFVQLFLGVMESVAGNIKKNKALFAFRQVQPISGFIATSLFQIMVKISVLIAVFLLMYVLNIETRIDDPLNLILSFTLLSIIASSVGIIFAIAEGFVKEIARIRAILTRPIFFISGVFFSLQDFSKEVWPYLSWNPILQAIELARSSAYKTYAYDGVSFSYLTVVAVSMLFMALSVYTVCWKRVISR